uniref:Uncharacterized protein n=1 Tax=Glossina palpalis gambiensis TaxID=67801 RepID=A0A1B0BJ00_9MUSC
MLCVSLNVHIRVAFLHRSHVCGGHDYGYEFDHVHPDVCVLRNDQYRDSDPYCDDDLYHQATVLVHFVRELSCILLVDLFLYDVSPFLPAFATVHVLFVPRGFHQLSHQSELESVEDSEDEEFELSLDDDDELEPDDDDDDVVDDELALVEEEDSVVTFTGLLAKISAFIAGTDLGAFFKNCLNSSVKPPKPMDVKKLIENRVFRGLSFGKTPAKLSIKASSLSLRFSWLRPIYSANSWNSILMNIRLEDVVSSSFCLWHKTVGPASHKTFRMFVAPHSNPETCGKVQFLDLVLTAFSLVYGRIPHNPNWMLSMMSPEVAGLSAPSSSLSEAPSDSEAEPALEEEPSEAEASLPNISRLKPFISNMAPVPFEETSVNFMPHSFKNAIATSTESSVGISTSNVNISKANIS